jgi:hypothetical protein
MTARQILIGNAMPSRDPNGRALPAYLKFFLPMTSTLAEVFTDSSLTVALAQPIVSDDAGRFVSVWADEETYFDVTWYRLDTGANIETYANVRSLDDAILLSASQSAASANASAASAAEAAASAAEAVATIAALGDFSDAVAAAEAAAVETEADKIAAASSAAAAAASAASIDADAILSKARGFAICAAVSL